ncbi:MAG: hypothetical protein O2894_01755 [Planctomycetota bacterium]|nr:hypothetical protein [Planctomycetota bacterium]
MPPAILYFGYLTVMGGGLLCFLQAFRHRRTVALHKRWALVGTGLSLGGIAVVLVGAEFLGWRVPQRIPWLVSVHRAVALFSTALLLLTAITGALRIRIHTRLYVVFLPAYVIALLTAVVGYRP